MNMPKAWPKPEAQEHWEAIRQERTCLPQKRLFCLKPDYEFHLVCVECGNMYQFCDCLAQRQLREYGVTIKDRTLMMLHMRMKFTSQEERR